MPHCDCVFRISIWAVASVLDIQVGVGAGVSEHLYRFSRSRRVLLYKLIGRDDRMRAYFPQDAHADLGHQAGFVALSQGLYYNAQHSLTGVTDE